MPFITRDVTSLDDAHRRAFEDLLGRELAAHETLIISVDNVLSESDRASNHPVQSLADWTALYADLSEAQVDQLDQVFNMRMKITSPPQSPR